jgi:hypothetical protein
LRIRDYADRSATRESAGVTGFAATHAANAGATEFVHLSGFCPPGSFRRERRCTDMIEDKPVAEKPVADKPVADKPVADKPVADKP